jgi:hypothetical protein
MRNRWADEFEQFARSAACAQGHHDECAHRIGGPGGGLNPRRFRLEFGAVLCQCECHAGCPVGGRRAAVPERAWQESCSCPAAEQERQRRAEAGIDEILDFTELRARSRQRSEARREARDATRAAAAGKSQAEVRDIYLTELRARGLDIPPDEFLDATVDELTGDYRSSARLVGHALGDLAKFARDVLRPPL